MADKYIALDQGKLKEKKGVVVSTGVDNAGAIPALADTGKLHPSVIPSGSDLSGTFKQPIAMLPTDNLDNYRDVYGIYTINGQQGGLPPGVTFAGFFEAIGQYQRLIDHDHTNDIVHIYTRKWLGTLNRWSAWEKFSPIAVPVPVLHGGTSATDREGARSNLDVYSKGEANTVKPLRGVENGWLTAIPSLQQIIQTAVFSIQTNLSDNGSLQFTQSIGATFIGLNNAQTFGFSGDNSATSLYIDLHFNDDALPAEAMKTTLSVTIASNAEHSNAKVIKNIEFVIDQNGTPVVIPLGENIPYIGGSTLRLGVSVAQATAETTQLLQAGDLIDATKSALRIVRQKESSGGGGADLAGTAKEPIVLASNSDLDDVTSDGFYSFDGSQTNLPGSVESGTLEVLSGIQRITRAPAQIYIRSINEEGQWSFWSTIKDLAGTYRHPFGIFQGDDLNGLATRTGIYHFQSPEGIVNLPPEINTSGILEVVDNVQRITTASNNTAPVKTFLRVFNPTAGTWSAWQTSAGGGDIPDPLPINRGGTNAQNTDDARTNLDVYSKAESAALVPSPLPIAQGGTSAQSAADARENLDVYSKAESTALVPDPLPIAQGGTSAQSAADARENLDVYSKADVNVLHQAFFDAELREDTPFTDSLGLEDEMQWNKNYSTFTSGADDFEFNLHLNTFQYIKIKKPGEYVFTYTFTIGKAQADNDPNQCVFYLKRPDGTRVDGTEQRFRVEFDAQNEDSHFIQTIAIAAQADDEFLPVLHVEPANANFLKAGGETRFSITQKGVIAGGGSGGGQTLKQTLALGNKTDGNNIRLTGSSALEFNNGGSAKYITVAGKDIDHPEETVLTVDVADDRYSGVAGTAKQPILLASNTNLDNIVTPGFYVTPPGRSVNGPALYSSSSILHVYHAPAPGFDSEDPNPDIVQKISTTDRASYNTDTSYVRYYSTRGRYWQSWQSVGILSTLKYPEVYGAGNIDNVSEEGVYIVNGTESSKLPDGLPDAILEVISTEDSKGQRLSVPYETGDRIDTYVRSRRSSADEWGSFKKLGNEPAVYEARLLSNLVFTGLQTDVETMVWDEKKNSSSTGNKDFTLITDGNLQSVRINKAGVYYIIQHYLFEQPLVGDTGNNTYATLAKVKRAGEQDFVTLPDIGNIKRTRYVSVAGRATHSSTAILPSYTFSAGDMIRPFLSLSPRNDNFLVEKVCFFKIIQEGEIHDYTEPTETLESYKMN